MPLLRTSLVEVGKKQGKDTATVSVRAGSKAGALLAARIRAGQFAPIREQKVTRVKNLSNDRFMDKWVVDVQDTEAMANLGE
jgi:hypothetical protein